MIKVIVWNEYNEFQKSGLCKECNEDGLHNTIKKFLQVNDDMIVKTATLDEPECGLSEEVLNDTDVIIWWGHRDHDKVPDEIANRVVAHIQKGMGAIFLHSAHMSKPFKLLMGTSCSLKWRVADEREHIYVIDPSHPIAYGLDESFTLDKEEMYGERFDVPNPDSVIFLGWFQGGNVFRSGLTYKRGAGNIFYFQPGHETYPTYSDKNIKRIITNAVRWAAPRLRVKLDCVNDMPKEKIM